MALSLGSLGRVLLGIGMWCCLAPVEGWAQDSAAGGAPPAAAAPDDPVVVREQKSKVEDKERMLAIWKAIMAFQKEKRRLPNHLSDLVPQFLPDEKMLLSSGKDAKDSRTDPKVKTPFIYEFRGDKMGGAGMPTHQEVKLDQLQEYGAGVLPMLRCFAHAQVMNVTYSGDFYESTTYWETSNAAEDRMRQLGLGRGLQHGDFIDLRIVNEFTGEPMAGVEVQLSHRKIYNFMELPVRMLTTDRNGRVRVPLGVASPPTERQVVVSVYTPGFLGPRETWKDGKIPEGEQVWKLKPATSVGGVVRKSDGTPLEHALVGVWVLPHFREGLNTTPGGDPVPQIADECFTDAQGRWHCDSVPPNFTEMTVRVSHRDMWSREFRTAPAGQAPRRGPNDSPTTVTQGLDAAALRAQKVVLQMEPRVELVVLLQKEDGSPASYENVTIEADTMATEAAAPRDGLIRPEQWYMKSHPAGSGPLGQVNFFWNSPVLVNLSACPTKDSALLLRQVKVTGPLEPVILRAAPRRRVAGKVVDAGGRPIEGVRVTYQGPPEARMEKEITRTNKNGDFAWDAAPRAEVELTFARPGYGPASERVPVERTEPLEVRLGGGGE